MFNEWLFHLCDCTCSNVMCILNCLSIKPKRIFEYVFLKMFLYLYVFRVFIHIAYFLFLTKNSFRGIFAKSSQVSSSLENEDGKNWKHWILDRNFCDCLTRKIYPRNSLHASVAFSWVTSREAYQRKTRVFSIKGQTMIVFQT